MRAYPVLSFWSSSNPPAPPSSLLYLRFAHSPHLQYIVFELGQTDLFNHLEDEEFDDFEDTCRGYLAEASDGMHYLHSRNIVHGDLKLENLLLVDGTIKLCDFG